MKQIAIISSFFILLLLGINACKKDKHTMEEIPRIKTETFYLKNGAGSYDSLVTTYLQTPLADDTFSYYTSFGTTRRYALVTMGNMQTISSYDTLGILLDETPSFLNNQAQVDCVINTISGGTYFHKYKYDENGFMIEDAFYLSGNPQPSGTDYYTNDGGNTIRHITYSNSPITSTVSYYTFFTDHISTTEAGNTRPSGTVHNKTNKNPVKDITTFSGNGTDYEYFLYEYDNQNRIITKYRMSPKDTIYDITRYTYF